MTGKKKLLWIGAATFVLLAAIVILLLLQPSDARLSLSPEDAQLQIGQTQQLQILSEEGKTQKLSAVWSSQSDVVATVDENGLVTAVSAGETRITAQVESKGKEYSLSTIVTVIDPNQADKVMVAGDATQEKPDFEGKCFTVYSATNGVTADMDAGTIQFSDEVKQTEVFFADSMNYPHSYAWELRGTINRENINQTLFLSFGVKDESGKDQWFCLYGTGLSRQRYWNWADTKYDIDNVHVGYNQAAASFYKRDAKADGNRLDFIAVLKDDVLKVYFGNRQEEMSLAWSLPLTKDIFGGFAAGSKYQLGINTVDPCNFAITDLSCKNGQEVQDLGGIVGGKYADIKISGDKFKIADSSIGVSYNGKQGTVDVKQTVKETVTFFAGNHTKYDDRWEFSGTIEKEKLSDTVFLSFGVRDSSGKTQWFCIYQNTLSLQKNWDWNETKQKVDGTYVKFNQPACSFFWKEKDMGAEKLHYKLILHDDVLTVYFGNDKYPLSQAWNLPLTQDTYGGFKAGSGYQLGIATVDPLNMHIKEIVVNNGDKAAQIPEFTEDGRFYIANQTVNVTDDPVAGTLEVANDPDKSEIIFAASPYDVDSQSWQLTGTVTKAEMKNLFLSFGVKDMTGKEQWFCIYQKGLARQRYYNWADTKYDIDGKYVFANPASEHFFYKTPSLGGDKLHFKLVLRDDVLKAYFGNDQFDMTLAWELPLTEELWGGFAAGSKYQLGINTVDPCAHSYTNVQVLTGDAVPEEEKPDYSNYKFFVDSASGGVTADPEAATIAISNSVSKTETIFKANAEETYSEKWQLTGTVTKTEMKNLFLSFGIRDENGKEQWLCIYNKGLSRQRYWNWADTKYDIDGKYVFANPASEHFFYKTPSLGGDRLHYKLVIIDDVLKAYFGNDQFDMALAWELPLTEELWGGFAAGSKYQIGINTVDPCAHSYTNVQVLSGDAVVEEIPEEQPDNNRFYVDTATNGVTANQEAGTITISNSVSKTETIFKVNAEETHSDKWLLTGTVTKTEMKNLFLSFGVRDESGKEQWFCVYKKGLARQRYWNWENTTYQPDGVYVIANPASEHFYYKTPSLGGDKLHYKLVIIDDVLKAYFGNDQFDMTLAWELPLTEALWGGFAAGSKYQLGINTVDPCTHNHSNVQVLTGDAVVEEIPGESDQPESSEGQYLLYSEDFESYTDKVDLSAGTNDSGWIYSKMSANGYAYIENGKLYFAGSKYDVLYRADGETWGNYTVEADISYNADNAGWAALAYNVQSDTKWQKASVGTSGNVGLNGYNTKWTNNDSALNKTQLDKMGLANTAANGQMRLKVSVKNTSATLWVAQYHDGVLGNWSEGFTIGNIYEDAQTGSIGFVSSTGSLGSVVIDNIRVYSDSLVTFAEDFDDYEGKVSLNAGDNSGAGKPGIFFHQGTNGATSYIQDGRLYLDASSKKSNYEHVYFTAGMNWTDYIVEMDLCTSADWIGMLHRVGGENNFQKAGVNIGGGTSLYGYTGVGKWQHNTAAPYKGTTTVKPSANQIYRLRVTVVNQEATLEIALYDANGVLGEYTQVLNASGLYEKHTKGSVGLMLNNNGNLKAWIDNVVVSRYHAGENIQNTEHT